MNIQEAIIFLEFDLYIDSSRLTHKEFSEQTKKVREIKKLLQKIKEVIK